MWSYSGWEAVTQDGLLARGPVLVHGVIVTAGAGGAGVATIRDGQNASAARSFGVTAPASTSFAVDFDTPVLFQGGLFVDVDANVSQVMVRFTPFRDDPPTPESGSE